MMNNMGEYSFLLSLLTVESVFILLSLYIINRIAKENFELKRQVKAKEERLIK